MFQIEDLEMFILNSYPENGFISQETNVLFKLGLNKEKCLEKIHNADNKFAMGLLNIEEGIRDSTDDFSVNYEGGRNVSRIRSLDDIILRGLINSNRLNCKNILTFLVDFNFDAMGNESLAIQKHEEILRGLPTFTVTEDYLKYLEEKSDEEVIKKCVICMEHFEIKELLKTLPCCII